MYYLQWKKNKKVAAVDREKKQFIIVATVWDVKGYLLGKSEYKHASIKYIREILILLDFF